MTQGVFKHYKGGLYTVLMYVTNSSNYADRDSMVVYVSHTTGGVYVRDYQEFFGNVCLGQTTVKRFEFVASILPLPNKEKA